LPAADALERCVGNVDAFLDEYWDERPLLRVRADAAGFADLLTLDDVDAMVSSSLLRKPAFRMVAGGKDIPADRYTASVPIGGDRATGTVDAARVWAELDQGATLALQSLHRSWAPIAAFCRALELTLTHPVQANAYITPPAARGLGVHHDTHDVFVLQLAGTKRWEVYEPVTVRPLPSQRWSSDAAETPLHLEATLHPGDALYVPRGYPHVAWTEDGLSAHLTIGVLGYTGIDVLRALLRTAEDDDDLRKLLPVGFADAPASPLWATALIERIASLAQAAAEEPHAVVEHVSRRFWSSLPAIVPGQLAQLAAANRLDDDSVVQRRPTAIWWPRVEGDMLVVEIGERTLRVPAALDKVLATLLDGEPHRLADLDDLIDDASRLVLARRLIREGVLEAL
jgi:ribosomal protein L16 Arg81 hydroxylase